MIKINLRRILKERKMSLANLSKSTGISTNALSSFQNQKTESVYYPTIEAITEVLNISVGELIENVKEVYEIQVSIEDKIELNQSYMANINFIGVEHDASYSHKIIFKCTFQRNEIEERYNRLTIYLSDELNGELPECIRRIIHNHDFTEHGKGLYYCIGYMLLQELMKQPNFSMLNVVDKIFLNTDDISYIQFSVEDTPKEISRNTGEYMDYRFREVINSLFIVTSDRSVQFQPHDPPENIQYRPYIESLRDLEFVTKVDIDNDTLERKLFIN